jgi:hypothetical protein
MSLNPLSFFLPTCQCHVEGGCGRLQEPVCGGAASFGLRFPIFLIGQLDILVAASADSFPSDRKESLSKPRLRIAQDLLVHTGLRDLT